MSPNPPLLSEVRRRTMPDSDGIGDADVTSATQSDFKMNKSNPMNGVNNLNPTPGDNHSTTDNRPSPDDTTSKNRPEDLEALRKIEEEEGPEVAEFFRQLMGEGPFVPGDSGIAFDKRPSWLDEDKLRQGQQFAQKYFSGVILAELIMMMLLFALPGTLHTLMFSGNSDTALKAGRRYLSTIRRVRAWFSDDPWKEGSEARRNLRTVRNLHALQARRVRDANFDERVRRITLQPPLLNKGSADIMRKDFGAIASASGRTICPFSCATALHDEWINQMEMSLTQWGFLGLVVSFPDRFGAGGASDAELDAFTHLWRTLGYLLGIEDRFNFASGGLEAVRKRTRALLRHYLLPALAHVGDDWEHMSRCVVEGTNMYAGPVDFEVALLYMCETVGAEVPHVLKSLSEQQLRQYKGMTWALGWVLRVAPLRAFINWRMHRSIDGAQIPSSEEEVEAKVSAAKSETSVAKGATSWSYQSLFFLLVGVQILIAVIWAMATN